MLRYVHLGEGATKETVRTGGLFCFFTPLPTHVGMKKNQAGEDEASRGLEILTLTLIKPISTSAAEVNVFDRAAGFIVPNRGDCDMVIHHRCMPAKTTAMEK